MVSLVSGYSKQELHRELYLSAIYASGTDQTELSRSRIHGRIAECSVIEGVEELRTELQVTWLSPGQRYRQILQRRQVNCGQPRSDYHAVARTSEPPECVVRKAVGAEPSIN